MLKAGDALKVSDLDSAMDVLTKTNHELLDRLNLVQGKSSGNSSALTKINADIQEEVCSRLICLLCLSLELSLLSSLS